MTDESRQKGVGCLMFAGVLLFAIGALLTLVLFGGGALRMANTQGKDPSLLIVAGFGPLFILLGIGLAIGGLVWGLAVNRKAANSPPMTYPGSRVLARYALLPGTDEMMFEDMDPTLEGIRFFAQMRLPDGRTPELRCPYPVFQLLGEGMVGTATVQGDWIGSFVPEPRADRSED